jgi:hypothetical protein
MWWTWALKRPPKKFVYVRSTQKNQYYLRVFPTISQSRKDAEQPDFTDLHLQRLKTTGQTADSYNNAG